CPSFYRGGFAHPRLPFPSRPVAAEYVSVFVNLYLRRESCPSGKVLRLYPEVQCAMERARILIVDDDEVLRSQMRWALADQYEVFLAQDRASALQILRSERPPLVTLDLGLPPSPCDTKEGFVALADMLQIDPSLKVIVITGQEDKKNALQAIAQGAYDFFCKPVNIEELKI